MRKAIDYIDGVMPSLALLLVGFFVGAFIVCAMHTEALNREHFRQFLLKHPASKTTYEEFQIIRHL